MSPDELIEAFNVIASSTNDYVEQEAAKIGNSQRSLGTLAERVASPSGQTAGLANYTYDRTLRPVVDTLTTELVTKGKAQALQNTLDTALRDAKNNYERSRNAAATTSTTGSSTTHNTETLTDYTGEKQPYIAKGTVISIGQQSRVHGLDGKMPWDIVVADGKGGQTMVTVYARTREDALASYYGQTGSGATYGSSGAGGGGGGGGGWGTTSASNSLLNTWDSLDIRNMRR